MLYAYNLGQPSDILYRKLMYSMYSTYISVYLGQHTVLHIQYTFAVQYTVLYSRYMYMYNCTLCIVIMQYAIAGIIGKIL